WFGFNGGSELMVSNVDESNAVAQVFLNTNMAAAGGALAAAMVAKMLFGKADLSMALNGALAGLVAITAEPLAPTAQLAMVIGALGGVLVVFSILTLDRMKIDDPVGAISVHGVVGIWGLFAVLLSNGDATFSGQILGIVSIFAFTFLASLVIWMTLKVVMGIRVTEEEEYLGMDAVDCGIEAYPEFKRA
ncbi:MAG TPA: ammonium transporter, partial [Gammaproteobacteria bacterium]|nr:ammonium transporter [Gammaproteobacteria bacterium]